MVRRTEPPPHPFLKWAGGKRQLLPQLLQAVDAAGPYRCYHEPFLGGGALFFALAQAGRLHGGSHLSDINDNLISTYRGIRDELDRVIELLKHHERHHDEAYFYRIRAEAPEDLAERSARVIYLNKTCFNGLYRENSKGQFNTPFGRNKNPLICDIENLTAVSRAMEDTGLEAEAFTAVLARAEPGDLVYFDPPYRPVSNTAKFTSYSKEGFDEAAQRALARAFAALAERGVKVILSNSMSHFLQAQYRDFHVYEVQARRAVNSRADRRGHVTEAIVTSFPVDLPVAAPMEPPTHPSAENPKGRRPGPYGVRNWLRDNQYPDVAALIDEVMNEVRTRGKTTNYSWWSILAGGTDGRPRKVAGREFPVLRAAQLRQGRPVTDNAISRDPENETSMFGNRAPDNR